MAKKPEFWLFKTEPHTYSFEQLLKDGKTRWDGVRNYQARNFLRQLKKGDQAFIYHSGDIKGIVGLAQVTSDPYEEPTQDKGEWTSADLIPLKKFKSEISLSKIKSTPALIEMPLIRHTRLSVMPVTQAQAKVLLELAQS